MKVLITEQLGPHKYKDNHGYLICTDCIMARTGKQTYTRNDCFGDGDMTEIEVDRQEKDVFDPKTLASFENVPITIEHPSGSVDPDNYNSLSVGYMRDIHKGTYEGKPVMMGTAVLTDATGIEKVESGELTNLSCGYDCDVDDSDHPHQTNIRGNHIALCEIPRAGITHIQDSLNKNDSQIPAQVNANRRIKTQLRRKGLPKIKGAVIHHLNNNCGVNGLKDDNYIAYITDQDGIKAGSIHNYIHSSVRKNDMGNEKYNNLEAYVYIDGNLEKKTIKEIIDLTLKYSSQNKKEGNKMKDSNFERYNLPEGYYIEYKRMEPQMGYWLETEIEDDTYTTRLSFDDNGYFTCGINNLSDKVQKAISKFYHDIVESDYRDLNKAASVEDDIVKTSKGWTNKGEEGTHGTFQTKKEARAQQKAMFANGYKDELKRVASFAISEEAYDLYGVKNEIEESYKFKVKELSNEDDGYIRIEIYGDSSNRKLDFAIKSISKMIKTLNEKYPPKTYHNTLDAADVDWVLVDRGRYVRKIFNSKKEAEDKGYIDYIYPVKKGTYYIGERLSRGDIVKEDNPAEAFTRVSSKLIPDAEKWKLKDHYDEMNTMNELMIDMNNTDAYAEWIQEWPDESKAEDGYFKTKKEYEDLVDYCKSIYKKYHDDGLYDPSPKVEELAYKYDKELGMKEIQIIKITQDELTKDGITKGKKGWSVKKPGGRSHGTFKKRSGATKQIKAMFANRDKLIASGKPHGSKVRNWKKDSEETYIVEADSYAEALRKVQNLKK